MTLGYKRGMVIAAACAMAASGMVVATPSTDKTRAEQRKAPSEPKEQRQSDRDRAAARQASRLGHYASFRTRKGRSKNSPTKRKLKANRCHISKRVRRKHRRAA